jgi:hypothetical protein
VTDTPVQSAPTNGHAAGLDMGTVLAFAQALAPMLSQRADGWSNIVNGLGQANKDARLQTKYCARAPIDQQTIENLYEQDDIFPLIVDRIPEHGTRRWIRITGATDKSGRPAKDFSRQALESLEEIDAQSKVFDLWRLHRLYGGAAMVLGIDDGAGDRLERPVNMNAVKALRFINVVNRWEITPSSTLDRDPTSPTYRQPETYTLNSSAKIIHSSRIIRLDRTMVASDTSTRGVDGWDLPVLERVWEPLRQFGSLYGWTESIFQDLVQGVVTLKGLANMLSQPGGSGDKIVLTRLQTMSLVRSMLNMIVLDEGETYERRNQVPMGLSDIIIRIMDRLAAAAEMPLSILFGQPPTGLSTDDQSGRRAFYDSVANKQRRLLRRLITYLLQLLIAASEGPFKGKEPEQWAIEFLPLEEPNEKENADQRAVDSQTEERLVGLGIVLPMEVRGKYLNDPNCPWPLDATLEPDAQQPDPAEDEVAAEEMGLRNGGADPEEREDAFDPNQPRDELGRWGEGGGHGSRPLKFDGRSAHNPEASRYSDPEDEFNYNQFDREPHLSSAVVRELEDGPQTDDPIFDALKKEDKMIAKIKRDYKSVGEEPPDIQDNAVIRGAIFSIQQGEYSDEAINSATEILRATKGRSIWAWKALDAYVDLALAELEYDDEALDGKRKEHRDYKKLALSLAKKKAKLEAKYNRPEGSRWSEKTIREPTGR